MKFYSKGHARRSLFHTAIFRALSQLATLASYVVLVRGMTEHAFGILSLLYAVIPVMSTVASLGIEQTLRRYQPEYLQAGQVHAAAWLMRVAASVRFATNVVLLGLIFLLWHWIAPIFQLQPYRAEFTLFSVLILLHFQASILQLALSSHMLQGYSVGMTVVFSVAKLLGYLVLSHFGSLTLTNAILADMAGYGLMYIGLRLAHARHCTPEPLGHKFTIDSAERRRLLRYSFFNNFNDAGTLLLTSKSDNFFIAALMNPVAVGAYSFYGRLNEMASQLLPIRQFSNVIQPFFFAIPKEEARVRIPRYFTMLLNVTMILQLPIAAFAVAYHAEIVSVLFRGKFIESSWLLAVIAGLSTVNRIADPVTLVAQYEEKVSVLLLSKLFGIYNAIAMLALVPLAGLYGAAIATGTAQAMKNLFVWWKVRGTARWTNFRTMLTMSILVWSVALAVCYALKTMLRVPSIIHLVIGVIVCGVATLAYVRSPAITVSDRQILASVFHGRESRVLRWLGILRTASAK